jgi:beta-lactam-binding protein with PASTA domain
VDVGLLLGQVDSSGVEDGVGVVDSQDPSAGTPAAPGSTVDITLAAVVALVTVPDVVGLTAREAGRALDAAGLQPPPVDAADLDRRVIGQSPIAGTAVPPASTVDVSLSSATTQTSLPWRAVAVVLAALAGASLLGRRLLRSRHDRRWVTEHVDVRPSAADRHAQAATHRTSSEQDLAVGLRGHRDDQGTQTLEEVHR